MLIWLTVRSQSKLPLAPVVWPGLSQTFKPGLPNRFQSEAGKRYVLCLQTVLNQQISPFSHKGFSLFEKLRFVVGLSDLARGFMSHL